MVLSDAPRRTKAYWILGVPLTGSIPAAIHASRAAGPESARTNDAAGADAGAFALLNDNRGRPARRQPGGRSPGRWRSFWNTATPLSLQGDRLAVDQAEAHPQCRHHRDDEREARQELSGTIAQRLNLEQERHRTVSELCILGFEPRK